MRGLDDRCSIPTMLYPYGSERHLFSVTLSSSNFRSLTLSALRRRNLEARFIVIGELSAEFGWSYLVLLSD
jgi:hypothetical protein